VGEGSGLPVPPARVGQACRLSLTTVPRLFGSANSRALSVGHDCAPSDTTVPRAAQSWHATTVPRLFGSANSRALPVGHDCAPSGTVVARGHRATTVRLGEQSCSPRRTRLCPERHSRGTRPPCHDCSARRTVVLSPSDTTVPRAAQSWHSAMIDMHGRCKERGPPPQPQPPGRGSQDPPPGRRHGAGEWGRPISGCGSNTVATGGRGRR